MRRLFLSLLFLGFALSVGAEPSSEELRNPYRFLIEGVGKKEVEFNGKIEVDGKSRVFENERTPFEFRCEAATSLTGTFKPTEAGRRISARIYDPRYSLKKAFRKQKGYRIHLEMVTEKPGSQVFTVWSEGR